MSDPLSVLHAARDHLQSGRTEQARTLLGRAVQRWPRHGDANHYLSVALIQAGQLDQAEYYVRRAIELEPARSEFHATLCNLLASRGRTEDAAAAGRRAAELDPSSVTAFLALARALFGAWQLDAAAEAAREAVRLAPDQPDGYVLLADALTEGGRTDEAHRVLREADARLGADADLRGCIVPHLIHTGASPAETFAAHAAYGRSIAAAVPADPVPVSDPDPERPLRIGYLSPDLHEHSVAYFFEPALEHRDAENYKAVCYSTWPTPDAVSRRLRAAADGWVDAANMDDASLLRRIRADRIDVLVDLAGHTMGGRLAVLAQRAAPVQATHIGYPDTTGLPTMDYRIVDGLTDPDGAEALATERLVRLDPCFLCYRPPEGAPPVALAPCEAAGFVTFASFNALRKHSPAVFDLWARILAEVPGSRLLMKNRSFADPAVRERTVAAFAARGVDPARIEAAGPQATTASHLELYARADIALDTFPYNGTTTTCEALWMGVPVVSLAGDRHAARVGGSLLTAAGLPELVARDADGYVAIARELAGSPARLKELRAAMRARLAASPLLDGPAYARRLEGAYRRMWRERCATPAATYHSSSLSQP